jgi:hypothetical protein
MNSEKHKNKLKFGRELLTILIVFGIVGTSWLSSIAANSGDVHKYAQYERKWWENTLTVLTPDSSEVCTLAVFAVDGYSTAANNYADSTITRHYIGTNIFDISLRVSTCGGDSAQLDSGWVEYWTYSGDGPITPANNSHCFISRSDTGSTWYPKYRGKTLTAETGFRSYRLGITRGDVLAYVLVSKVILDSVTVEVNIAAGNGK